MRLLPFICILIVVLSAGTTHAADIDALYYGTLSPFVFVNEEGRLDGCATEVVRHILAEADIPLPDQAYKGIVWARALDQAEHTQGTGIFCLSRTAQREDRFKWVGPIDELTFSLWAQKSRRIEIDGPQDFNQYRIGVVRNSAPESILRDEFDCVECTLDRVKNHETLLKMLHAGRVDMITYAGLETAKDIGKGKYGPDEFEQVYILKKQPLYLALNKATDDALVARLQAALDKLKTLQPGQTKSTYQEIHEAYR